MWIWLRRMFWLSLVCSAGYALYAARHRKHEPVLDGPPEWPALDVGISSKEVHPDRQPGEGARSALDRPAIRDSSDRRWAEPTDGRCPEGFPIKANDKSRIFHVPGGRFYDRTTPERCYPDEASAQADGYRRAKA